jgi:hypothetical protein
MTGAKATVEEAKRKALCFIYRKEGHQTEAAKLEGHGRDSKTSGKIKQNRGQDGQDT